jgi:hypothetical protein
LIILQATWTANAAPAASPRHVRAWTLSPRDARQRFPRVTRAAQAPGRPANSMIFVQILDSVGPASRKNQGHGPDFSQNFTHPPPWGRGIRLYHAIRDFNYFYCFLPIYNKK